MKMTSNLTLIHSESYTMTDLLPCPFCGGEVSELRKPTQPAGIATCGSCHAAAPIEAWNSRPSPWIPVEERLPEPNVCVLAVSPNTLQGGHYPANAAYWQDDGYGDPAWRESAYGAVLTVAPTHWMPLPAPPTKGEAI